MAPDKLPKEIADQINNGADLYGFVMPYDGSNTFYIEDKVKGYQAGATAWAPWKVKYGELKEKYDNILATEDGHLSQTENVWQSGYASGHEVGYEKANHKVRNELQKQFIDNDVKWAKECQSLNDQAQCMADALEMTIRHAKECEELYNISGDAVIESAEAVLQQFKDGKEVGDE